MSRVRDVYTCMYTLIEEMDGAQRADQMVERMRALLVAVNAATPDEVIRIRGALAELAWIGDNSAIDINTQGEGGNGGSLGQNEGVSGRW